MISLKHLFSFALMVMLVSCAKNNSGPASFNQTATPGTYGNYFFYDSLVWNGHFSAFLSTIDSGIAYPDFDSCTVWASGKKDTINYSIKTTYKTVPAYSIVCQLTINNRVSKFSGNVNFSIGGAVYGDTIKAVYVDGLTPTGALAGVTPGKFTLYEAFNIPVRFVP